VPLNILVHTGLERKGRPLTWLPPLSVDFTLHLSIDLRPSSKSAQITLQMVARTRLMYSWTLVPIISCRFTAAIQTTAMEMLYGVAVDASQNVYATGQGNGNFLGETSNGGLDAFLVKYSSE
jgi:hypothetical protein